jgi:putative peptide maturation system protein
VHDSFERALSDAVALLRDLPRDRNSVEEAHALFRRFREALGGVRCDLLVDHPPASDKVDYDILLGTADGSTVVVSWCPDDGTPWNVHYADHWAANYVLTVNGRSTSIQSALVYLNTVLNRRPNLMEELVNGSLILQEIVTARPPVSDAEMQKAVDDYRIGLGLRSAAATRQWLDETGLTASGLRQVVEPRVMARKVRERLTAGRIRPYFDANRKAFDVLTVFRVQTPSKTVAAALAKTARRAGLLTAVQKMSGRPQKTVGQLETMYACEFPNAFSGASAGTIVGPEREPGGYSVAQLIERGTARLDRATRTKIEDMLFKDWLTERRRDASIRWHWM